ncbi:MAG TPA: co-chaperone GroES [Patescibacteria group bacterium]|nr:co-chaperone GroES [Patescibacteria group bacterium]
MSRIKYKPTAGYVLIEPQEAVRKTPSGIVLPDTHEEKPQVGRVVAVGGPQKLADGGEIKAEWKTGDMVVYSKWAGKEFKIEGKEMLFVKFDDILAVEVK